MQRGPVIAGLPTWYQELQLRKFIDGTRGKNPENKSEYLMGSGISLIQSEEDLQAIATYFSRLPAAKHIKTIRGDNLRGAKIYEKCVACHGAQGKGRPDLKSPPLIVQEDWYLYDQMVRFEAGLRGGTQTDREGWLMHLSTQGMNIKDFRDVVSYINDGLSGRISP
jgi:cytochrome c oxidase subunit 2